MPGVEQKAQQPNGFPKEHYDAYMRWRAGVLDRIGSELATQLPTFYGNVQFNLQGGTCVNVNVTDGHRPQKSPK